MPAFRQVLHRRAHAEKLKSLSSAADGAPLLRLLPRPPVQRRFARAGLSGDLSYTDNDYVGVFSQNLNGSKNDYYQHRDVTDTVRLGPTGAHW